MKETIEQASESFYPLQTTDLICSPKLVRDAFIAGATWQLSQPNPHRIYITQVIELEELYYLGKITRSRMVEILNEISSGKHKERIEI
jgi:hypothetical protein